MCVKLTIFKRGRVANGTYRTNKTKWANGAVRDRWG